MLRQERMSIFGVTSFKVIRPFSDGTRAPSILPGSASDKTSAKQFSLFGLPAAEQPVLLSIHVFSPSSFILEG